MRPNSFPFFLSEKKSFSSSFCDALQFIPDGRRRREQTFSERERFPFLSLFFLLRCLLLKLLPQRKEGSRKGILMRKGRKEASGFLSFLSVSPWLPFPTVLSLNGFKVAYLLFRKARRKEEKKGKGKSKLSGRIQNEKKKQRLGVVFLETLFEYIVSSPLSVVQHATRTHHVFLPGLGY